MSKSRLETLDDRLGTNDIVRDKIAVETQQIAANTSRPRPDWIGKFLGFLVFAAGLAMLGFVFYTAYQLFNTPLSGWIGKSGQSSPDLQSLANIGTIVIIRILFLFLMTVVGSIVTNRGIQMYFSAGHHPPK